MAIVGVGPRGLSVFERIGAYLTTTPVRRGVRIVLIDDAKPGAGRIWRTDQAPWLTMNTVAGELTMFSGSSDGGPCRPGAGCTFTEWIAAHPASRDRPLGPDDYASRSLYGEYLEHILACVCASLDGVADVVQLRGRATAIRHPREYVVEVSTDDGTRRVSADRVVLATGHPVNEASGGLLAFVPGDSAADLPLADIPSRSTVGILGMGLSFYDIVLSLTVGRGGRFRRGRMGCLAYQPSGAEPHIVAGSRTGVPIRTRGTNQKSTAGRRPLRFLTQRAVARCRQAALRRSGSPALDFRADIGPLLLAEINHTYLTTVARAKFDADTARRLADALYAHGPALDAWPTIAAAHGLTDVGLLDLESLWRPFADRTFADPAAFRLELMKLLLEDIDDALLGNVNGPVKAALDVVRDAREVIRSAVEVGGLTPDSYREFHTGLAPMLLLLSTGPPPVRTRQLLALMQAGIVDIVGPDVRCTVDPASRYSTIESPSVNGSARRVTTLIDGRIPAPILRRNRDPLVRQLLRDGLIREFVNSDDTRRYPTGGLWITAAENRVVSVDGSVDGGMYAVGIPTENVRWFTQIGNGRPDVASAFHREADAIALSLIRDMHTTHAVRGAA